jgi:hypothetical protein
MPAFDGEEGAVNGSAWFKPRAPLDDPEATFFDEKDIEHSAAHLAISI